MTSSDDHYRTPRAVQLDEPEVGTRKRKSTESLKSGKATKTAYRDPKSISSAVVLTSPQDDPFLGESLDLPIAEPRSRRKFSFGKLLMASLGILFSLAFAYWVDTLVRELFDRLPWLGWAALGVTIVGSLALLALIWRELRGLARLEKVADLQAEVEKVTDLTRAKEARKLVHTVSGFLGNRPQTAKGRAALADLETEVVDAPQLIAFAERELLGTLDREAKALVVSAARRVSVVTAISPRASIDMLFVGWQAIRLVRSIAVLYGGRPGTFGMIRLFRDVIAHLAVTGTVAAGDSLIQQAIGHGIAARISARLGEGVINGLMTARIGISAMDLCRPMPFSALKRPGVGEFFTDLTKLAGKNSVDETKA